MTEAQLPKVIMHNTITLDGAFSGFEFTDELLGLHYKIAAEFGDAIRLVGSNTLLTSIELFGGFTAETEDDLKKPNRAKGSIWIVPDSHARLQGKLHHFRRSEYCRDLVVLISQDTPAEYINYLVERDYDLIRVGQQRVDLKLALLRLRDQYKVETILVDAGQGLTNAMLNAGLINTISLLVLPSMSGKPTSPLFQDVRKITNLSLKKSQTFPKGILWLMYDVIK
jgi:2,5-diamino-6-(ribosylamino)-4(3H)-pyrimidinone 5'-phosphate reductase